MEMESRNSIDNWQCLNAAMRWVASTLMWQKYSHYALWAEIAEKSFRHKTMLLYYAVSMNFAQNLSKHGLFICEKLKLNFIIIDHMVLFYAQRSLESRWSKCPGVNIFPEKRMIKMYFEQKMAENNLAKIPKFLLSDILLKTFIFQSLIL